LTGSVFDFVSGMASEPFDILIVGTGRRGLLYRLLSSGGHILLVGPRKAFYWSAVFCCLRGRCGVKVAYGTVDPLAGVRFPAAALSFHG
jgi:hypothetical protein